MTVTGTAVFDSNPPPDAPNRLGFTNVSASGIEPADLVFSTNGNCTSVGTTLGSFIIQQLQQQFATRFARQCGAPGAALFTPC
jgi:hypothetical protein